MKICLVTSSFPVNGADFIQAPFIPDVIRALTQRGHTVIVFTQSRPEAKTAHDGLRVEYFSWSTFTGRISDLAAHPFRHWKLIGRFIIKGTFGLRELHVRENFDAVLCCWAIPSGLIARLAACLGRMPPYAVWALGSDVNSLKNRILGYLSLRWVLRGARARFADGLALAADVRRISNRDCEFLPTFRSLKAAAAPTETRSRCFLFVGRHEKAKGVDLLIEALILLRKQNPELKFAADIVGDGPLTEVLRSRVANEDMASHIRFRGKVQTTTLAQFYQASDCVVIPSLSESIPLVMGEAIQFQRPLIVTDVGDMGYLVRKFDLGQVVERSETQFIKEALELFLSHPAAAGKGRWEDALAFLSMEKNISHLVCGLERMALGVPKND
jgi:glycosyltransferase involved in cell wall biosynthesis